MKLQDVLNNPKVTVVDVREPLEFFFGHVKDSTNIPLSRIASKVGDFKKMDGPVVLVCRSGNRSGQALSFLKSKGLKNLYNGGSWTDVKRLKRV